MILIYKYDGSLAEFFKWTSVFSQPSSDGLTYDAEFVFSWGDPLAEFTPARFQ